MGAKLLAIWPLLAVVAVVVALVLYIEGPPPKLRAQKPIPDRTLELMNSEMGCAALVFFAMLAVAIPTVTFVSIDPLVRLIAPRTTPYIGAQASQAIVTLGICAIGLALLLPAARRLDMLVRAFTKKKS